VIVKVPASAADVAGVNVTLMMQVPPLGATVPLLTHVVPVATLKSAAFAPLIATAFAVAKFSVSVPVFVSVTVNAALVVPFLWLPNASGFGAADACGSVPVPLSVTVCVELAIPPESSVMATLAACAPVAVGVNFTPNLQLPAGATGVAAVSEQAVPELGAPSKNCVGFVPPNAMLAMLSVAVPVLVTVTSVPPLLVPFRWFPNGMLSGATLAFDTVPVPFSATDCVPGEALSVTCSVAVRGPVPTGLNVTPMTHDPLVGGTVRLLAQFVPVTATIAKSLAFVPVMITAFEDASVTEAVPLFVNVTVVALLIVLIGWFPKFTGEGASVTLAAVPVPVSETVCVAPAVPPESSVNVSVADRAPVAVGVNVRLTTQEPFCPKVLRFMQVVPLAMEKSPGFVPVIASAGFPSCRTPFPVFVNVTLITELVVLTGTLPKGTAAVERLAVPAVPVPLNEAVCVVPAVPPESSVIVRVAASAAAVEGVKVKLITHEFPGPGAGGSAVLFLHVVVAATIAKSAALAPLITVAFAAAKFSVSVPVFVTVTVIAGVVDPLGTKPKLTLLVERLAVGAVPVPFSVTVCDEPVALSLTVSVAVRAPNAPGLNVTLITHVPLGAVTVTEFVQVVPAAIAKSAAFVPLIVTALDAARVTVPVPVFVSVTVTAAPVVFTRWLPNGTGEGLSDAESALPVTVKVTELDMPPPVPEFVTVTGKLPAVARSLVKIAAITCPELTRLVVRALPLKLTVELLLKFVPFTVNEEPGVPAGAVFVGDNDVIVGTPLLTVRFDAVEVPPPGTGLNTVMATEPGVATSLEETLAVSCVALTKVVGLDTPATFTVEPPT